MAAQIISGDEIAKQIRDEVRAGVVSIEREGGPPPGLATVLVGENPASQSYVRMKNRDAKEIGFHSRQIDLPAAVEEAELLGLVEGLNAEPSIHGILVQLPLPGHIDEGKILDAIHPSKDVDGLHPVNVGRLSAGDPRAIAPCTPRGVIEMLMRSGNDPAGRHVVVVGRSNLVGKPMAALLLGRARGGNATVTIAHSQTRNLGTITREADILIVAIGRPGLVRADMVRHGAVVIDVGVNRIDDSSRERGFRLVGDVDFEAVREVASAITPVPGGVGPMTRAMLLANTLAARLAVGPSAGDVPA